MVRLRVYLFAEYTRDSELWIPHLANVRHVCCCERHLAGTVVSYREKKIE